jgi:hypothetical protein
VSVFIEDLLQLRLLCPPPSTELRSLAWANLTTMGKERDAAGDTSWSLSDLPRRRLTASVAEHNGEGEAHDWQRESSSLRVSPRRGLW